VGMPRDAHRALGALIRDEIGENHGIRNGLDQPSSECWCWNAEDDVRVAALPGERIARRQEVRLHDIATAGISSSGHDEQIGHPAVRRAVRLYEARLADRPVPGDEPRHAVAGTRGRRDTKERIDRRTRAAQIRLLVAGEARVGIEAWSEAISLVAGG